MKLSAHKDHKDYHLVSQYIKVLVDGKQENYVVSFDTSTGQYVEFVYPFNTIEGDSAGSGLFDGELEVQHKQNDSLTFDVPEDTPKELVQDWYRRENKRGNI